jgi:hypothetical protein
LTALNRAEETNRPTISPRRNPGTEIKQRVWKSRFIEALPPPN